MLRALSRKWKAFGGTPWSSAWLTTSVAKVPSPPRPPSNLPQEIFEWDFLLETAETEEEKKDIQNLKNLFTEAELLDRRNFKTTVDWEEFEGKVPEPILQKYKELHSEAVKEFNAGKFDLPFDQTEWDKTRGDIMKVVHEIVHDANKRYDELEAEIQKTEGKLSRLETATLEEELALDPELAKRVDDAVSKELGYTP